MLTRLSFQSFKSWRDTGQIPLAPVTAFFGSNSSGKSSILQILLLLKQTAESSDRAQVLNLGDDRSLVELGTFQDVLFEHDLRARLQVELAWSLPRSLEIADPAQKSAALFKDDHIDLSTGIEWQANGEPGLGREVVQEMKYSFSGEEFGMRPVRGKALEYDLFVSPANRGFKFVRTQGRPWPLPPPVPRWRSWRQRTYRPGRGGPVPA